MYGKQKRGIWKAAVMLLLLSILCTVQAYADAKSPADTEKEGFYKENGKTRYYKEGRLHKGFLELNGKKYYFDAKGNMVTGSRKIGSSYYYFGVHGVMKTGFVSRDFKGSKIKAYYDRHGCLKTGTFRVSGVEYKAIGKTGRIYSVRNLAAAICQRPELPTGCEITAWTMMANYAGVKIKKTRAADIMPRSSDPNQGFVGSPYSGRGGSLIVYPGGLRSMTLEYLGSYKDMTGCGLGGLKAKLWDRHLVLVWVRQLDGFGSHTIALTGYDQSGFFYNDPWTGTKRKIGNGYLQAIWAENAYRAMSY